MLATRELVFLFILAPLAWGAVAASPQGEGRPDLVSYSYWGPSALQGDIMGECDSWGVKFTPRQGGSLVLETSGGRFDWRTTWQNYTRVDDDAIMEPFPWMEEQRTPLGPGRVDVAWPASGLAIVYQPWDLVRPMDAFRAQFEARSLNASSPDPDPATGAGFYGKAPKGSIGWAGWEFIGWSRTMAIDGAVTIQGNVTILVREGTIGLPSGERHQLGDFERRQTFADAVVASRFAVGLEDALLHLNDVQATFRGLDAEVVCAATKASVVGFLAATGAAGEAQVAGQRRDFDEQVLTLEGAFDVDEQPRDQVRSDRRVGWMEGTSEGAIAVVGLDFVPTLTTGALGLPLDPVTAAGLGALLTAGVLAAKNAGSVVGLLYARFGPEKVLDHPRRRLIYDQVLSGRAVSVSELATRMRTSIPAVRFHVRVLNRTNKVVLVKLRGSWLVVPTGTGQPVAELRRTLLLARDPKIAHAWGLLAAGPRIRSNLVAELRQRFAGLSERGARHVLERGRKEGLFEGSFGAHGHAEVARCGA